jgi:hypothetical protein
MRGREEEGREERGRRKGGREIPAPVLNVDTDFSTNRTFPYTTSPIFPFFIIWEGWGVWGDVTKYAQKVDIERICYANRQFGRNWMFLTAYSPGTPTPAHL